jgi:hypothetical protein
MATWSDLGLVAVGGGIGLVSSYVTQRLQIRSTREDRRADARAARVERFARVLGLIRALLIDLSPGPYVSADLEVVS